MPEVAFVMSERQHYPLRELADTLQYELGLQAVPATVHRGGFPEPRPSLVYVLLDPRGYVAAEGGQGLPKDAILRRTIFLCAEPPPTDPDEPHLALLRRAGAVFAVDQRSVIAMHRVGIQARLLRPGYSKSLDRFDPSAERPIDVMFLGAHSLRRTRYLCRAAHVLSHHNCLLQVSDGAPSPGDTSSYLARGRWPLLAQTKVLMSLHRDDEARFDWRGALDAIHTGAVVVAEHSNGIAPLVPGEHLLVASADSLPYVIESLLRDEPRLARLRAQAYERLRAWIPFALPVAVLRAAIVELVGEPVPPDALLDTPASLGERGDSATSAPALAAPLRKPHPARLEAQGLELIHETPAWAARRAPQVTAITAAGADHHQALATVESLVRSRLRDFELVVVDTRASDQTRRAVQDWMIGRPRIAARLIGVQGVGLGAARNVGLDFVRGPFCLILDAGNELYPRCLEVLVGTLRAMHDAGFVYPIAEVTGQPQAFADAGGDYLLSFLGWDPGRLRRGNYIHTPILIRTDRLRELGGFATDARLDGFEDFDLWCRTAERGWRGQLVPQELARRSESGSSRTLSSIHPSPGAATAALQERAPALMSGAFGAG